MEITNGPIHAYGNLTQVLSAPGQGQANSVLIPDPNDDRGPSMLFAGTAIPDIRYTYRKDQMAGYPGVQPMHLAAPLYQSINQIPATLSTENVCGHANVQLGVAMTLATATTGITLNIPISPFQGYGMIGSQPVITAALALDWGFAFGNVTAASTTIVVADSTQFSGGMPLVIATAGNAAGTACLLTNVASITDATHIVVVDTPLFSNATAPMGTGNSWPTSESGIITPTFYQPYLGMGPALMLDPIQCITRAIRITGEVAGCIGGTFLVSGYDLYGMALSQLVTVAAGVSVGFTTKAFKYVASVVPQFTDANNYSVGTTDFYSFAFQSDFAELVQYSWNGAQVTDGVGWIAGVTTTPATNLTGDVRGGVQVGTVGPITPVTTTNPSNGTIVSLAMSGRRLCLNQYMPVAQIARGIIADTRTYYGPTQV